MKEQNQLYHDAKVILKKTSRTFFIPISQLVPKLKETVSAAYLCMRAIDEIEDHPTLRLKEKEQLLLSVSEILQKASHERELAHLFQPFRHQLPTVTLRLADWVKICPPQIVERVLESTVTMAKGMAEWARKGWKIYTKEDLDSYTYYVAGLVGIMLTDIWEWYDNTRADKELSVGFGRGLQAVNILRNQSEDAQRGVNYFPYGWGREEMFHYARQNLSLADRYLESLKTETIYNFCKMPLVLAHGTLKALEKGKEKMSRMEVLQEVKMVYGE